MLVSDKTRPLLSLNDGRAVRDASVMPYSFCTFEFRIFEEGWVPFLNIPDRSVASSLFGCEFGKAVTVVAAICEEGYEATLYFLVIACIIRVYVCVCVCVCARARARVCTCVCACAKREIEEERKELKHNLLLFSFIIFSDVYLPLIVSRKLSENV